MASSDAKNIRTSIRQEGNEIVINGHKWRAAKCHDYRPSCLTFGLIYLGGSAVLVILVQNSTLLWGKAILMAKMPITNKAL